MNSNITFVYFIVDSLDEYIFFENKIKDKNKNIIVVTPENYVLKESYDYKQIKINNLFSTQSIKSIFNYIKTDWLMIMKPEEVFINTINTNKIESGAYNVLVKMFLSKDNKNMLLYGDIKLFHKNYDTKSIKFLNTYVLNYNGEYFPHIENRKRQYFIELYKFGNRELKTILYLLEKRLIKMDLELLLKKYYLEGDKSPENLELLRYIGRQYIISKDFEKAKEILFKALLDFPNSPCINSLLAETHFILGDYNQAELFILNCLKMGKDNSFYMNLPFNPAIIGYAAHYYLAKIYYKMEEYEKSKVAFEDCIDEKPDFEIALKEYKLLLKEMPSQYVNELNFSCQGCGNCCRKFKTVNINHQDVLKIIENKPELKFEDIVDYYYDENLKTPLLSLKKKKDSIDCMFLENNLCVINDFKPLGCKIWPFTVKANDIVTWTNSNRAFIKDFCSFKQVEGSNNRDELIKEIKIHKENSDDLLKIFKKWENKIDFLNDKLPIEIIEDMKQNYYSKK